MLTYFVFLWRKWATTIRTCLSSSSRPEPMKHKCSPPAVEPKIRICRFILEIGFLYLLQSPVFELLKVRQQFRRIPLDLPKTIEHINILIFSFFLLKYISYEICIQMKGCIKMFRIVLISWSTINYKISDACCLKFRMRRWRKKDARVNRFTPPNWFAWSNSWTETGKHNAW